MVFCPQCGTKMPDEANFCINCGENLAKYRASSGFVKAVAPAPEVPPAAPAKEKILEPTRAAPPRASAPPPRPATLRLDDSEVGLAVGGYETIPRAAAVERQVKALIGQARAQADAGKLQESVDSFAHALLLDPESTDAWYGQGIVLGRLGQHGEALGALNRLLEIQPRLAPAWDAKGIALAALGQHGLAVSAFDESIQLDASQVSAWLNKGLVLTRIGDLEAALACFDSVLEREDSNTTAWVNRGDVLYRLGDAAKAMRSFDRALALEPSNGACWRKKGDLLLAMGHPQDALRCFDRALQLDVNDLDALLKRGDALRASGDAAGAVDAFDRVAKLAPSRAEPLVKKGLLLFSLQQFPAARDCFARAKELDPESQVAAVNHAIALLRCRDYAGAAACAEESLVRWPGQHELSRVLSAAQKKLRTPPGATARVPQPIPVQHTVEDIFVIYRDGRLLMHHTRRLRAEVDNQLLSGMLTAIQNFIQEAFREDEEGQLNQMAFGRSLVLIERGRYISLAVVIRGTPPVGARAEMVFAVQSIEQTYGGRLERWDGDTHTFHGMGEVVKRLLEVL